MQLPARLRVHIDLTGTHLSVHWHQYQMQFCDACHSVFGEYTQAVIVNPALYYYLRVRCAAVLACQLERPGQLRLLVAMTADTVTHWQLLGLMMSVASKSRFVQV
jgi:hypothetical protein